MFLLLIIKKTLLKKQHVARLLYRGEIENSLCAPEKYPSAGITKKIIGCCIEVHSILGPGLLESVYEEALSEEFKLREIEYERQKAMNKRVGLLINFNELRVKDGIKRLIL